MQKILIIGLGLIGGSLAKALKESDLEIEIDAVEKCEKTLDFAKKTKIIEKNVNFSKKFVKKYDLVAICCPLSAYGEVFKGLEFALRGNEDVLIVDFGSLKEFALDHVAKKLLPRFVACHVIAGSQNSGFEHSLANLFAQKKLIICKNSQNSEQDIEKIVNFAEKIGLKPDFLEFRKHDEIYALVSHLPQFLSFLTKEFAVENGDELVMKSFRIGGSNPKIWAEIFSLNDKNIEKFYIEFYENLLVFEKMLQNNEFLLIFEKISEVSRKIAKNLVKFGEIAQKDRAKLLFRLIVVASYLEIDEIEGFLPYAGSGFADFTEILGLIEEKNLTKWFKDGKNEVLGMVNAIS